jgi:L-lactate dehydrogenase complex protein LldE
MSRVAFFVPCLVDAFFPEVAEAAVAVLQKIGYTVSCPAGQTCCGQPAFNAGYRGEATVAAERFIAIFEDQPLIVTPSGSCAAMVKQHYPALFAGKTAWLDRARRVAEKTYEFCQFLVDVAGVTDVGARFEGKVTYHASCHLLNSLGIDKQPRRLIANVSGLDFVEMAEADRCCGFGGTFSVKYPEISGALVQAKVETILASGAGTVTGADMGCLMNIKGRLSRLKNPVRVLHIAQILASQGQKA